MLTPEYLQGLPEELTALTEDLEKKLLEDIARRVSKAGTITDTAAYQIMRLKEMGASTKYIEKLIADYTHLSEAAIERMVFDAAQTDSEFYRTVYARTGRNYVPYEYNPYLQQLAAAAVNQTKGELKNLTQSMGFAVRGSDGRLAFSSTAKAYQTAMDKAHMLAATGGMDYITAVRMAVSDLTASGLYFVDYASGVRNHADVAARRAILTGISQMTGKIAEHNAAELGTDVVEVDAHAGARPDHAVWQGKRFSLAGKDKRYPLLSAATGYGTVTGLKGANCRHDFYPVIPGIDEPAYTEEELRNIDPPPVKIDGKVYTYYEAEQRQRAMERAIRKTKRELIAAQGSGGHAVTVNVSPPSSNGGTGKTYHKQDLTNIGGSGIINAGSENVALEYQRYGRNKDTLVNKTYIDSGEYRRKFDKITDNPEVNKTLYNCAKTALEHRSGTLIEDMYWVDGNNGKIVTKEVSSKEKQAITYSDKTRKIVKNSSDLISIHTHPGSMPPSIEDFNSCFRNGYVKGVVACHDGKVFVYSSSEKISGQLYEMYIKMGKLDGLSEFDAQINALKKLMQNYKIDFWEV